MHVSFFYILDMQNVAYQQNKSYFRIAKIKAEIKKRPLSHLISAYKNNFYMNDKKKHRKRCFLHRCAQKIMVFRRITRIIEVVYLVDSFQGPIYNYIRRMVVSHEDAEDVLQESLYSCIPSFRPISG